MEQTAFAALERYGVLGIVAALLIAAFIWYQRTQDKFRDEERVSNRALSEELQALRAEARLLRAEVKALRDEIQALETTADEWRGKYEALRRDKHHPRHEEEDAL